MRVDHDFPVDQFVAEASTPMRLDGVSAGVRITVHEAGMQDTHVRPMHLHDQAMWLEPDFGVNPVGTSGVEDAIEEKGRSVWCAKRGGADTQKHDSDPHLWPHPYGKRVASGTGRCWVSAGGGGIRQGIHRSISKIG